MKKIMWIVAVFPVVVASMVLQLIPDMVPHKIGNFIFPIVILCITFFWHLLICIFEKKAVKASTEKERMEANSSARVLCVVGLSQAIMFGIMNFCILYSSCVQKNGNGSKSTVDIARISFPATYIFRYLILPFLLHSHNPLYRLLHNLILIEFLHHLISCAESHRFTLYVAHMGDFIHFQIQVVPIPEFT